MSKVVLHYQKPEPGARPAAAGSWLGRHLGQIAYAVVMAVAWTQLVGWIFVPAENRSLRLGVLAVGWLPEAVVMFVALRVAQWVRGATGAMKFSILWALL